MQEDSKIPPGFGEGKEVRLLRLETQLFLEKLIDETVNYPKNEVEAIVWELTYFPKQSMFVQMSEEELTETQIMEIREEILRRYRLKNPWWSFGKKYLKAPYKRRENVIALKEAAKGDEVTIQIAMTVIEKYIKKDRDPKKVERAIRKLKSRNERFQFSGLMRLGFYYEEALFLRPCANAMGAILEELYQN